MVETCKGCVASLGVIDAAVNKGQLKDGVQNGPSDMRKGGLDDVLRNLRTTEYGIITQPKDDEPEIKLNCRNQQTLVSTTLELKSKVEQSVHQNDMTLVLGGDHSIGIGAIEGHFAALPNSVVVWVDAHADINTPASSNSRKTHGMPLSFLFNETSKEIPRQQGFEKLYPVLNNSQIIYIGLRDVESLELEVLKKYRLLNFDMSDVKLLQVKKVMDIVLWYINKHNPESQIHLSFDIDALDPQYAPSTGTPVEGGLSLEEGKYICTTLAQTGRLKSMAVAEVNTSLGSPEDAKKTINSAIEVIKSALLLD